MVKIEIMVEETRREVLNTRDLIAEAKLGMRNVSVGSFVVNDQANTIAKPKILRGNKLR